MSLPVLPTQDSDSTNAFGVNGSPNQSIGQPISVRPRWFLYVLCIGVGVLLSVVVSIIQWMQTEPATRFYIGLDGMRAWGAAIGAVIFVVTGICMYLRVSVRKIVLGYALTAGLVYLSSFIFRIDSFYGNRVPRLTFRWSPTPEEQVQGYFASNRRKAMRPDALAIFDNPKVSFPGLLGENRDGVIRGTELLPDWTVNPPKVLWKHPVGLGWSSFSIQGSAGITMEQRGDDECVVCYDLRDGSEVWCHRTPVRFHHEHGDGPRSTPTIDNGRVYAVGATGILRCINLFSGELEWQQHGFSDPATQNIYFGTTSSPWVEGQQVLVSIGAGPGRSVIAYSVDDGRELWASGDDPASYASLSAISVTSGRQLLSFNGAGLRSYSFDGQELWFTPWLTQGESRVNVAQPVLVALRDRQPNSDAFHVLISSGYEMGTTLVEVSRTDDTWSTKHVWKSKYLKSKFSNFVVHEDYIYGLDNGLLTCIRLADGERMWKRGRYGHGQLMCVGNKLLIMAESGEICLVDATHESHRELGRFPVLDSKTWNHLALAGSLLVVRNDREAAAVELSIERD